MCNVGRSGALKDSNTTIGQNGMCKSPIGRIRLPADEASNLKSLYNSR
jgi:hypothetical protein